MKNYTASVTRTGTGTQTKTEVNTIARSLHFMQSSSKPSKMQNQKAYDFETWDAD